MSANATGTAMRIQCTDPAKHLTARNRQVIHYMLAEGWTTAHTRQARYQLECDGTEYVVTIVTREADDWGRMRERRRTARFTLQSVQVERGQLGLAI